MSAPRAEANKSQEEKTAAEKQQEEKKKAEQKAWNQMNVANAKQFFGGRHKFKRMGDNEQQSQNAIEFSNGGKLLEPGVYKLDGYITKQGWLNTKIKLEDFHFTLGAEGEKSSISSPSDMILTDEEFKVTYSAMFDLLQQSGRDSVTIEWDQGVINKERLAMTFSLALERNMEIKLGAKVSAYLNDIRHDSIYDEKDIPSRLMSALGGDPYGDTMEALKRMNKPSAGERDEFLKMVSMSQKRKERAEKIRGANKDPVFNFLAGELSSNHTLAQSYTARPGVADDKTDIQAQYTTNILGGQTGAERAESVKNELDRIEKRIEDVGRANKEFKQAVDGTKEVLDGLQQDSQVENQAPTLAETKIGRTSIFNTGEVPDYTSDVTRDQHLVSHIFDRVAKNWTAHSGANSPLESMKKVTKTQMNDLSDRVQALKTELEAKKVTLEAKAAPTPDEIKELDQFKQSIVKADALIAKVNAEQLKLGETEATAHTELMDKIEQTKIFVEASEVRYSNRR